MENESLLELSGIYSFFKYYIFVYPPGFRYVRLVFPALPPFGIPSEDLREECAEEFGAFFRYLLFEKQTRLLRTSLVDNNLRVVDLAFEHPDYCLPDIATLTSLLELSVEQVGDMQKTLSDNIKGVQNYETLKTESLDFVIAKLKEIMLMFMKAMDVAQETWCYCANKHLCYLE